MGVVGRFKTHSFEKKIDRVGSRFARCVDCIYIFLLGNLMDRIGQDKGSGIRLARIGENVCAHDSDKPAWGMRALFYGC